VEGTRCGHPGQVAHLARQLSYLPSDSHAGGPADTGTLKLDNSATFAGTVAGMTGHDTIDFTDIDPTKAQAASYSGDTSGGTLSVTDGTHTATR
jgi:hypothetical protein